MNASVDTKRRVQYALGYIGLGLMSEAGAELDAITEAERGLAEVKAVRVDLHMAARQWRKVVIVASELARSHPEVENAWIGWAYALRELKRVAEAKAVLLQAEPRHGDSSAVLHYNLACYDSLLGELAGARKRLATACKMDGQFRVAAQDDPDLAALRAAAK